MLDDDRLIMPRAEHQLLWALATRNNQVVTWVELHHALWPTEIFINPDPLYSHLSRLRQQLRIGLGLRHPDLLDNNQIPIRTIVHVGVELQWPPKRLQLYHPKSPPWPGG